MKLYKVTDHSADCTEDRFVYVQAADIGLATEKAARVMEYGSAWITQIFAELVCDMDKVYKA